MGKLEFWKFKWQTQISKTSQCPGLGWNSDLFSFICEVQIVLHLATETKGEFC